MLFRKKLFDNETIKLSAPLLGVISMRSLLVRVCLVVAALAVFMTALTACSNNYEKGYNEGLTAGKDSGYNEGYDKGYKEGFDKGKAEGDKDGYSRGHSEGIAEGYENGYKEGAQKSGDSSSSRSSSHESSGDYSDDIPENVTYILNKNTGVFHYPSCSSVKQMKESNKIYFEGTREEAIELGYRSCGRCNP